MMTGYLLTADGRRVELPPFSAWELRRTGGVPCDSFEGSCPWEGGVEPLLAQASRVILEEEGARRFTGVLDEYELSWGEKGGRLTLSGRGLAALLLDNEAVGQDYQVATLADILRDHVEPYGIPVGRAGSLPAVPGFSVASGASEWQVVNSFAHYHAGVRPRFDAWGSLTIDPRAAGRLLTVDDRTGVTEVVWRDRRYGVCSEILLWDRKAGVSHRVVNDGFARQGGRRRKVMVLPGKGGFEAARYSGQFQLDRSAEERQRVELTVPGSYFCEPGDRFSVALTQPAVQGTWEVLETRTVMDGKGCRVKVTLG